MMGIVKYEQKDILPLVLIVSFNLVDQFMFLLYDRVIEQDFPDLKGLVDPDRIDLQALQLIELPQDPFTALVVDMLYDFEGYMVGRIDLYGYDIKQLINDEPINELGINLWENLVVCLSAQIPLEVKLDNLHAYIASAAHVIWCLCLIMVNGELDADKTFDARGPYCPSQPDFQEMLYADDPELKLLATVGRRLSKLYSDFFDLGRTLSIDAF